MNGDATRSPVWRLHIDVQISIHGLPAYLRCLARRSACPLCPDLECLALIASEEQAYGEGGLGGFRTALCRSPRSYADVRIPLRIFKTVERADRQHVRPFTMPGHCSNFLLVCSRSISESMVILTGTTGTALAASPSTHACASWVKGGTNLPPTGRFFFRTCLSAHHHPCPSRPHSTLRSNPINTTSPHKSPSIDSATSTMMQMVHPFATIRALRLAGNV